MRYRSEIDGLRAVAVVPVILYHAGSDLFSGGYVGVDVFFVISGYLITSILVEDLAAGRFSIARFYERRARRILPALFLVLLCTTALAWAWMVPSQLDSYARALVAVVLFVSNVHFWRAEDYFAPAAELNPLLHTWSLAVEEQFYIAFPIFLLLLWRFGRRRMLPTIGALSLASLALAEWGWRNEPAASFFLLPTRAWELGAGALCALVLREGPVRGRPLLAGLGLGLIAVAVFAFDDETPFPSLYALAPVGGTALVILFARAGSPVARLLSLRAMVGIGLVSYSAYLWHQPLFALARVRSVAHPSPELMLGLVLATFALAYLSWRFVEQPFRGRTPVLSTRPAVFAASGAAAAVFVGVGLYGQATAGRFDAWMAANPERAGVYGMAMAADAIDGVYRDDGACQFNVPRLDAAVVERLRACRGTHGPGIAVLGDSHGVDFFNGLDALHDGEFVFAMTYASCWLGSGSRNCDFEGFARLLGDHPGLFERVIFHQAGYRFLASNSITAQRELFERIPEYTEVQPGEFRILESRAAAGLPYLARLAELSPLVWVGPRIEPHIGLNYMLNAGCDHAYELRPGLDALFTELDRRLAAASAAAGVRYVSLIDAVRFDPKREFMTCDELYWRDGDHWSLEGAKLFVGRLLARDLPALRAEADDGRRRR